MEYAAAAWERAMLLQEVMLKAIGGELHWFRAAEILGMSPRSLRRGRERYERKGYGGLIDRRRGAPSAARPVGGRGARVAPVSGALSGLQWPTLS
jgi:hypothetical protein